jgi:penicillin-binding protein 2
MAHVIGYLGDINAQEVEQIGLDGKSQIGKDGLEKVFDKELRGEDGIEISEKSINDDESKSWIPKSYRYGDNVYLTIDLDWQKALYKYLERESVNNNSLGAAAIVMEADSGKIKALVNYPTYDLNLFAQGISQQDFDRLVNDDSSPLLNRVIAMQIPTGSTFKIFMAAALQQEQVINKNSVYKSGCYQLPGDYELCEADKRNYGSLNMISALARSSNPYFCQASVEMARKFGSDELAIRSLDDYFSQFGFGKTTGIDLPGEQPGTIPSPELKLQLQGENWYLADLCNTAIGQGLVAATPLQTARALSAIVNGGIVYKPQIIEKFEDADLKVHEVEKQESNRLAVDKVYLDNIKEGMRQAADYGSASGLNNSPGNPIAKTGSSEATVRTQSGQIISGAHSWAIGSFEHGNKDYVFVVTQQFGGRGYKSVPIARDFIECVHKDFQSCK